jgi:DNA-binding XRE family transcriptional regulator
MQIDNILRFLSLRPVHITHRYQPKPRYWRSTQQIPEAPQTLGGKIKKHRLKLGLFQRTAAAKIGISSATLSDWERGVTVEQYIISPHGAFTKTTRLSVTFLKALKEIRKSNVIGLHGQGRVKNAGKRIRDALDVEAQMT